MPIVLVLLSAACFGTTGTAQAYGPAAATSGAVGLTRIVTGGLLLAVVGLVAARSVRLPAPGPAGWFALVLGAVGVVAYQPTFFAGARLNGVAIGAVVTLGTAPVATGLLEWLVSRRRPSRRWALATVCSVAGVVLVSGLVEGEARAVSVPGLLASAAAGLSYAVYTLGAKRLMSDGWPPTVTMGAVFGLGALVALPLLLLVDLAPLASADGAAMTAWLAVVTVALAYVLFGLGLRHLSASTVATLTLAEPLTATVLGVALLDERFTALGGVGLGLIVAGVALLSRPPRRAGALS